ncbi:MAG: CPBP family intramembrane metalloprotease [Bacteroidales bacterium]|nr:CPBP family intramembrane metalloprotease [Bacteroidales bacterium]
MNAEKQKWFELLVVIVAGMLKFVFMDWLDMRAFYIVGMCLFWSGYILFRYSKDHEILKHWGYKKKNFRKSMTILLPFIVISIIFILGYGILKGAVLLNWHILPVILLYPAWGLIQQFMMVNLIADNVQSIRFFKLSKFQIILITSLIFGLVHHPHLSLMMFTFVMEVLFLFVFFRWRNLWALGLAHGWIATFLLYYALNRDLWIELFAWF